MSDWHPILAARELRPGLWVMEDQRGEYGRVELVKARPSPSAERVPVYKLTRGHEVIGWAPTLRTGCEVVHRAYIAAHGPEFPGYPDFNRP